MPNDGRDERGEDEVFEREVRKMSILDLPKSLNGDEEEDGDDEEDGEDDRRRRDEGRRGGTPVVVGGRGREDREDSRGFDDDRTEDVHSDRRNGNGEGYDEDVFGGILVPRFDDNKGDDRWRSRRREEEDRGGHGWIKRDNNNDYGGRRLPERSIGGMIGRGGRDGGEGDCLRRLRRLSPERGFGDPGSMRRFSDGRGGGRRSSFDDDGEGLRGMNSWGGTSSYSPDGDCHQYRRRHDDDGGMDRDSRPRPKPFIPEEEEEGALFRCGIASGINFDKYESIPCKVSGDGDVPSPVTSFESSGLRQLLIDNTRRSNYRSPTPVQKYSIPIVMKGRDLMACAQTGSGKTAAFLLPILHSLMKDGVESNSGKVPQTPEVVVLSPTRELAVQIKDEARKFSLNSMIRCAVVYGGTSVWYQKDDVRRGVNVLIATPGRLLDFVESGTISFRSLRYLVLDEADRMLDMGFMPDIQRMVRNPEMPAKERRQTLMFSATFSMEVQAVAAEFLSNYLFLAVGRVSGACTDVTQTFLQVSQHEKRERLMEILKGVPNLRKEKTLVFVETKKTADFIATYLCTCEDKFPTTSIHGDRYQVDREAALRDFRTGRRPILLATGVAARGLDIKDVALVVNFDLPKSIDEYVHRIGRTGRVGNTGRAISFYESRVDGDLARDLLDVLAAAQQEVPIWLEKEADSNSAAAAQGGGCNGYGRGYGGSRRGGGGRGGSRFGSRDFRDDRQKHGSGGFAARKVLDRDELWN